jgi:hypothetical protein
MAYYIIITLNEKRKAEQDRRGYAFSFQVRRRATLNVIKDTEGTLAGQGQALSLRENL